MTTAKTKNKTPEHKYGHIWLLVLFALVLLLMAVAISFAAQTYNRALQAQDANARISSVEGYLNSTLKANDASGDVSVQPGPQGDMLRVVDANGMVETCIYLFDGHLVQEYKAVGTELSPQIATPIAELSSFKPSVEGSRVTVATDAGTFVSTLRSGGETR